MKVLFPASLADARAMRAAGDVVPVAGGTDVLVRWPERPELHDRTFLDLGRVRELRGIRWEAETLELGALATYWDVERDPAVVAEFPLLADAARLVGAVQIQARGTWAGNVANGSPAADGVPVLMAYDAAVVLESPAGRREVALDAFYTGYKQMELRPDELIVALRLPRRPRARQAFVKVGSRRAQAIAKIGLALARPDDGWRVVAASVAPTVKRCRAVEAWLDAGNRPAAPEDLLPALRADVAPIDDLRSSAAYRETVLARVLHAALADGGAAA